MIATILLSVLSSFMAYLQTHTLQSDVRLTVGKDVTQAFTYTGSITMAGERFKASILGMEAAYDGNTFYLYREADEELTLSTPTQEELGQNNPLYFAQAMAQSCHITERVSGEQTILTMTPQVASDIQRIELVIKEMIPVRVEMKEAGKFTRLEFVNPQYISQVPAFVIAKPDAYLNDLR